MQIKQLEEVIQHSALEQFGENYYLMTGGKEKQEYENGVLRLLEGAEEV